MTSDIVDFDRDILNVFVKNLSYIIFSDKAYPVHCGFPDSDTVRDVGIWCYDNQNSKDIFLSNSFLGELLEWSENDIKSGYLYFYFYILKDDKKFIDCCNRLIDKKSVFNASRIQYDKQLNYLNNENSYALALIALIIYPTYWQDDFFSNPIHWDLTNNGTKMYGFPIQVAKDPYHHAYFTQEFIVELFGRYCCTWIYSEQKSKKKVYVFTRPCKISDNYEWCIIVQIPKIYNATFQVVLSKKNTKKLNSKDIVFQCYFPLHLLQNFSQNFYLSSWKANAIFRYHYVERYINYIEPLVFECMNGNN